MTTRIVTTFYEAADGTEPDIQVTVSDGDNSRECVVETDLSDLPEAERQGVRERAEELYWAAESTAWEAAEAARERNAEEIRDERSDDDVYAGCE